MIEKVRINIDQATAEVLDRIIEGLEDQLSDKAKDVYGVIVEVSMKQGLDIVAAYADHSARYFNYSGAAVIWENPDDSLREEIENLLNAGKKIIHNIGP